MKNLELSIIIVNFNTKNLTLKCIESIKRNKPKSSFEIIVMDNGSTDGSVDALKKLTGIIFVDNKSNLGFAKANNIGIKKASGRYILLLNSDTQVKKGSIDKLLEYAKKNKNVGAVTSRLVEPNGKYQASIYHLPNVVNAVKEYWFGQKGEYEKYLPKTDKPLKVDAAVMASFLITPEVLKEVGYLDERYFMYFEDLDYCRRIKKKGLDIVYLPDSKVVHYHGASGKNLVNSENQWRRLIPSSKLYHGLLRHYIIFFISWSGQKFRKLF